MYSPINALNFQIKDARQRRLLGFSLNVSTPGIVAIVGPRDSGKSLLLAALAGRIPKGYITSGKLEPTDFTVPPEAPLTAHDVPTRGTIFRALINPSSETERPERRVQEVLTKVGLWEKLQTQLTQSARNLAPVDQLILLACRSLVRESPFLLLDDPTSGLDPEEASRFDRAVVTIAAHIPVFWASRSLRRISACADRILVLREGNVLADDTSDKLVVVPPEQANETVEALAGHTVGSAIDELYHELLTMGSRAERAVHQAVQALTAQNLSVARDVIQGDDDIDERERQIQDKALGLVGRKAPVGRDLRTLTTVIQAAKDLERIADHATNISEVTLAIGEEPLIKPLIDIPRMAEKAQAMVRQSLDALVRRDVDLADEVYKSDQPVDALYSELFEELLGFITDGGDAYRAGQALYLLFVARYLERVADHATNIAEHVIFMVEGKRVPRLLGESDEDIPRPFLPR